MEDIERWILHANYKVQYRPRIRNDLLANLRRFPGFRLNLATVDENREPFKVVSLEGTLQCLYQHQQYGVPIVCLITPRYPYTSPAIYVRNPPNTSIQASCYVENNGLVKHPSVVNWDPERSSLGNTISDISLGFSQYFPIVSNSNSSNSIVRKPVIPENSVYPDLFTDEPQKKKFRPDSHNPMHSVYFQLESEEKRIENAIEGISMGFYQTPDDPVDAVARLKKLYYEYFIVNRKKEKAILIISKLSGN